MRTYQANTKDKKLKRNKKLVYAVLLGVTVLLVGLIITLSLTLGRPADNGLQTPPGEDPPVVPIETKPKFTLPLEDFTLGKEAVLDRLVWNSSLAKYRTHNGADFIAVEGSSVLAVSDGTVLSVEHTEMEASVVKIQHADGLVSIYKGLGAEVAVEANDTVKMGDAIGVVAAVMPYERHVGAHLHLEMTLNNALVNPMQYLPSTGDK